MAYAGTTAATSVSNPPMLVARALGGGGNTTLGTSAQGSDGAGVWIYASSHSTEVQSTTFFTDALQLGMKAGDVVFCVGATGSSGFLQIGVIGSVTTAGAGLTTAQTITSTFT